jgi:MerR family mercuric resistance operon transcriptional regulator
MDFLTRGELANLAHVNPETIRFYEREGILPVAERARNGYRKFSPSAVERIQFVGRAKGLGFSLQEIRELLHVQDTDGPACLSVKSLLTQKLVSVHEKRQELAKLERQIKNALQKCERSLSEIKDTEYGCPVFCCVSDDPAKKRQDA